jgi:hypothetical protein
MAGIFADRRRLARWIAVPAIAGALLASVIDPWQPPIFGSERLTAVLLVDGQAYFGHVIDLPWSDTIELRDVYYFQDARNTTTNVALGLVKRGTEVHQPTDGISVRRDKVLAIEQLAPSSPVRAAIAAERAIAGVVR